MFSRPSCSTVLSAMSLTHRKSRCTGNTCKMMVYARDLRIVFCVRIESRIESAVYTTQAVTPSNELQGVPCRRTM